MNPIWNACVRKDIPGAEDVLTLKCLPILIGNVIYGFLVFAGVVALFVVAWSGVRMIISGGDAKQVGAALKMMRYGIWGLTVVLFSFSVLFFIGYITKTTGCITNLNKITTGCL